VNPIYYKYGFIKSLTPFFYPESIAIFPAKNEFAQRIIQNLIQDGFSGKLYLINNEEKEFLGIPCKSSLKEIDEKIDLLILTENYPKVFLCMQECVENKNKIQSILMISSGIRENSKIYEKNQKKLFIYFKTKQYTFNRTKFNRNYHTLLKPKYNSTKNQTRQYCIFNTKW